MQKFKQILHVPISRLKTCVVFSMFDIQAFKSFRCLQKLKKKCCISLLSFRGVLEVVAAKIRNPTINFS
uniref:Uncharacterized protein n=1 Tax=Glossina austeni TaxID=7395 RepID=A0A1A9VPF1_GLOAU